MGCNQASSLSALPPNQLKIIRTLTVSTLNYSGIMNNPFQFYCEDYLSELKLISRQFIRIIPIYFRDFNKSQFEWKMGKIDHIFRTRYSPMFILEVGMDNQKFMTQQAFKIKWDNQFRSKIPKQLEQQKQKINGDQKQKQKQFNAQIMSTQNYDLAMFHALLKYVFPDVKKIKEKQQIDDYKDCQVKVYKEKLKQFIIQAIQMSRSNFKKIDADIFFFQQYKKQFYQYFKDSQQYHVSEDIYKDTFILVKKASFKGKQPTNVKEFMRSKLEKSLIDDLNWAQRTAFMVIDKYFLLSAHLTSKEVDNISQMNLLRKSLLQLKSKLPSYTIILGGDLNSFLQQFSLQFNIYPKNPKQMTTVKKRTFMQGQFHKANEIIYESKDKIVSTLRILEGRISYINGKNPSRDSLVPTHEHPFDHFVVVAILEE